MADEVATFGGGEESQGHRHERTDLVKVSGPRRSEKRLQFGERELNRIEVGTVRREKPQLRADGFNRGTYGGLFVDGEIVEDNDIPRPQRRDQDLVHIGEEGRIVDRPVEDGGSRESLQS